MSRATAVAREPRWFHERSCVMHREAISEMQISKSDNHIGFGFENSARERTGKLILCAAKRIKRVKATREFLTRKTAALRHNGSDILRRCVAN